MPSRAMICVTLVLLSAPTLTMAGCNGECESCPDPQPHIVVDGELLIYWYESWYRVDGNVKNVGDSTAYNVLATIYLHEEQEVIGHALNFFVIGSAAGLEPGETGGISADVYPYDGEYHGPGASLTVTYCFTWDE